jgi:hypothetical protein
MRQNRRLRGGSSPVRTASPPIRCRPPARTGPRPTAPTRRSGAARPRTPSPLSAATSSRSLAPGSRRRRSCPASRGRPGAWRSPGTAPGSGGPRSSCSRPQGERSRSARARAQGERSHRMSAHARARAAAAPCGRRRCEPRRWPLRLDMRARVCCRRRGAARGAGQQASLCEAATAA